MATQELIYYFSKCIQTSKSNPENEKILLDNLKKVEHGDLLKKIYEHMKKQFLTCTVSKRGKNFDPEQAFTDARKTLKNSYKRKTHLLLDAFFNLPMLIIMCIAMIFIILIITQILPLISLPVFIAVGFPILVMACCIDTGPIDRFQCNLRKENTFLEICLRDPSYQVDLQIPAKDFISISKCDEKKPSSKPLISSFSQAAANKNLFKPMPMKDGKPLALQNQESNTTQNNNQPPSNYYSPFNSPQ